MAAALVQLPLRPALAHAPLSGANDFYAGLVHPLTDLPAILPLLALGLMAGQAGRERGVQVALAGVGGALAGGLTAVFAGWHPAALNVLAWGTLATALLVAADLRLTPPAVMAASAALGAALGVDQASALPTATFAAGIAVSVSLALLYLQALVARIAAPWARIGVRVAGSWLAAIQVMMLGLALR